MRKPALPSLSIIPSKFPHPVQQHDVPNIPRSLLYLASASLLVSFILFIVSMLDLGYLSLFLCPPASLFTLAYFTIVLVLSQRKRAPEDPSYFSTVILCAYLLALLWLVALILTIVVYTAWKDQVKSLNRCGMHSVSAFTQGLQCFLCVVNLGLVGGFAGKGHMIAYSEGEPEHWRPKAKSSSKLEQGRPSTALNDIDIQAWIATGENTQSEKDADHTHPNEDAYQPNSAVSDSYYRYPEADKESNHSEEDNRDSYYSQHDVEASVPPDDYGIEDYYMNDSGKNDAEVWRPEDSGDRFETIALGDSRR